MGETIGPDADYMQDKADHVLAATISQADVMQQRAHLVDPARVVEVGKQPAVWVDRLGKNIAKYDIENIPNEQAMRVVHDILPKVLELYLKKSKDYGGNVSHDAPGGNLGPRALFPDMWRKMGKLRRSLWEGKELQGEQTEEILMDLVGHVLIVLDELGFGRE